MLSRLPEFIGIVGVVLNLTAIWLQLSMQRRVSRLEDRRKDGRLTGEELETALRWTRLMPMVCTLVGTCLLIGAVMRLLG